MSDTFSAARKGDRHSHSPGLSDRDGALLSAAAGALIAAPGEGGVATSTVGAGVASAGGGAGVTIHDVVPHSMCGAVAEGSPRTFLGSGNLPVAHTAAEPLDCHRHKDGPIRTGSATVFADGFRLARAGDQTNCGSTLCDGEKTIQVGGPPDDSAPPDPLAALGKEAASIGAALGNAIAAGTSGVAMASRWAESIASDGVAPADRVSADVQRGAAALASETGALLGDARDAVGSWMGLAIGGR